MSNVLVTLCGDCDHKRRVPVDGKDCDDGELKLKKFGSVNPSEIVETFGPKKAPLSLLIHHVRNTR